MALTIFALGFLLTGTALPLSLLWAGVEDEEEAGSAAAQSQEAIGPEAPTQKPLAGIGPQDRSYVSDELEKVLEFERTGQEVPWQNPATGNSGSIVILRTYFFDPKTPCRDYEVRLGGKPKGAVGSACRRGPGDWRAGKVSARPAERAVSYVEAPANATVAASGPDLAPSCAKDRTGEAKLAASDAQPGPEDEADAGAEAAATQLDIVFVLDMTASMGVKETAALRSDLWSTIRILHRMTPDLQVGIVAFRDRNDEYLIRSFDLAPMHEANMERIQEFLQSLKAHGGGDQPEPIGDALKAAAGMPWRSAALGRIVVVGDAATHKSSVPEALRTAERYHSEAPLGPHQRQITAVFTGKNRTGRKFFDQLADAGGGSFVGRQIRMMECVLLSVI